MRIETERLILRPFVPGDQPAYAALWADPDVLTYMPGGAARACEAQTRASREIEAAMAMWSGEPGYGPWAVVEKASGRLIGHHGVQILPELGNRTEILYLLEKNAWGKGYASEGAVASRDFAFDTIGLDSLIGLALPGNHASIRVMEKIGMRRLTQMVFAYGLDLVCLELAAADRPVRNRTV